MISTLMILNEINNGVLLKKLLGNKNIRGSVWVVLWMSGGIYVSTGGWVYLSAIVFPFFIVN